MKIGIISDTHGQAVRLQSAIQVLLARGAEALVHCGDIGNTACLVALSDAAVPAFAVAGNSDGSIEDLEMFADAVGVNFHKDVLHMKLDGQSSLAITHGHLSAVLRQLIGSGKLAYVLHGHTHMQRDERIGDTRVLNPGALHHTELPTVALLDTQLDNVEFLEINCQGESPL